jgi:hypothetical protein
MKKTWLLHQKMSVLGKMMLEEPSRPDILGMDESLLNLTVKSSFFTMPSNSF